MKNSMLIRSFATVVLCCTPMAAAAQAPATPGGSGTLSVVMETDLFAHTDRA
jgi:hypothetical protein